MQQTLCGCRIPETAPKGAVFTRRAAPQPVFSKARKTRGGPSLTERWLTRKKKREAEAPRPRYKHTCPREKRGKGTKTARWRRGKAAIGSGFSVLPLHDSTRGGPSLTERWLTRKKSERQRPHAPATSTHARAKGAGKARKPLAGGAAKPQPARGFRCCRFTTAREAGHH